MKTAEFNAQKKRVITLWRHWAPLLGLGNFDVTQRFHDGPYVMGNGDASGEAIASAGGTWEYIRGNVDWNLEEVAKLDDKRLAGVVIHESMHILLAEIQEDGIKHEERVATMLEWAFLRVAEGK